MFEWHKKEAPVFTGITRGVGGFGFGKRKVAEGTTSVTLSTWSVNSASDFASDGVYNVRDALSGQIFYVYAKTLNSVKTLCVMAGRATGSGSEFYYSNSWWSNKVKINDNSTSSNIVTNTTTNFLSEGFFRIPLQGAFVTSVNDSVNPSSWIQYSGTSTSVNNLPNGNQNSIPTGTLTYSTISSYSGSGNFSSILGSANGSGSQSGQGAIGYWGFDLTYAYASGSNSISRSRFGFALTQELYSGSYYSANGYGFGSASDDQDGLAPSPGIQISSGTTNARSNAGNSGTYESSNEFPLEFWVIPQNTWTYYKLS